MLDTVLISRVGRRVGLSKALRGRRNTRGAGLFNAHVTLHRDRVSRLSAKPIPSTDDIPLSISLMDILEIYNSQRHSDEIINMTLKSFTRLILFEK